MTPLGDAFEASISEAFSLERVCLFANRSLRNSSIVLFTPSAVRGGFYVKIQKVSAKIEQICSHLARCSRIVSIPGARTHRGTARRDVGTILDHRSESSRPEERTGTCGRKSGWQVSKPRGRHLESVFIIAHKPNLNTSRFGPAMAVKGTRCFY